MRYKIIMILPFLDYDSVEMPHDHNLTFLEALWRVDIYSRNNPKADFEIEEEA